MTFAGSPIPVGKIYFSPNTKKGNTGPTGYADIKNGKYDTKATGGMGLTAGAMLVRIEGADGIKIDEERFNGKPLFPSYEVEADIPKGKATQDFDVPAAAAKAKAPTRPRPNDP